MVHGLPVHPRRAPRSKLRFCARLPSGARCRSRKWDIPFVGSAPPRRLQWLARGGRLWAFHDWRFLCIFSGPIRCAEILCRPYFWRLHGGLQRTAAWSMSSLGRSYRCAQVRGSTLRCWDVVFHWRRLALPFSFMNSWCFRLLVCGGRSSSTVMLYLPSVSVGRCSNTTHSWGGAHASTRFRFVGRIRMLIGQRPSAIRGLSKLPCFRSLPALVRIARWIGPPSAMRLSRGCINCPPV